MAVGAAVEEQNATTIEISRNIHEAATGSSEIVGNVTAAAATDENANKSAHQVERTAKNVAD
ncbi:MAG: hypothetical protein RIC14_06215 [Filomicrobium sp.]